MFSLRIDLTIPTSGSKLDGEFSQVTSVFTLSITCNITSPNYVSHNNTTDTEEQALHCSVQNKNNDSVAPSIQFLVTPFILCKIPPLLTFNPHSIGLVGNIGEVPSPVTNPSMVGNIGEEPLPVTNPSMVGNIGEEPLPITNPSMAPPFVKPPSVTELVPLTEPELISKARKALAANSEGNIELCEEGVGGTYFIFDNGKKFGIFKPTDEEPGAINNPKKKLLNPLLPPGGGSKREVAAYLIDKGHAGVPETYIIQNLQYMLNCTGVTKSGSLQLFIENDGDSNSMSSSRFLTSDVHNIGILDIRLFNMDRNGENILVRKIDNLYRLIPIDHTYILPPSLDNAWFEWHHWRQAKEPFSPETLQYIASIDIEKDAQVLCSVGIEEECIRTMKFATTLLKKGAEAGLNLFQIANIMCRKNRNHPSELEKLVVQSEEKGMNEEEFQRLVEELVMIRK